jgi:hypothetical protein
LVRDLLGQAEEDLAPYVVREFGRPPRKEESGRTSFPRDEDDVVGPKHLARAIAKVPRGYDSHVITSVVILITAAAAVSRHPGRQRRRAKTERFRHV